MKYTSMKVKELIDELTCYNPDAEFGIVVNDKPAEFEICCGGAEGVTAATCTDVTIFIDCTSDKEKEI